MTEILVGDKNARRDKRALRSVEPSFSWGLAVATGLTIAVVGWIDLVLLWLPLRIGDSNWEFGTLSTHFSSLPLGTIGVSLLAAGTIGKGWRWATRSLAALSFLVLLSTVAALVLLLLNIPLALRAAPVPAQPIMKAAILKSLVFGATYLAFYSWLGWYLLVAPRRHAVRE